MQHWSNSETPKAELEYEEYLLVSLFMEIKLKSRENQVGVIGWELTYRLMQLFPVRRILHYASQMESSSISKGKQLVKTRNVDCRD